MIPIPPALRSPNRDRVSARAEPFGGRPDTPQDMEEKVMALQIQRQHDLADLSSHRGLLLNRQFGFTEVSLVAARRRPKEKRGPSPRFASRRLLWVAACLGAMVTVLVLL